MTLVLPDCLEYFDKRQVCVAEENGKCYRLVNTSKVNIAKIKVDKCLPQKDNERRCDYLMKVDDKGIQRAIFIELKGTRLIDAVRQIQGTIDYLRKEFQDFQLDARIVGSGDVPRISNLPEYV
ncbi:MAG: hypothetical protein Q8943_19905, partial [Bacteroidota bacterium]|nr:hypothetical protein [Bacteroidota bacterium]